MNINATNAPVTTAMRDMIAILNPLGLRDRKLRPFEVTRAAEKVARQFGVSALDVEHMFSLLFSGEIELFPR